MIGFRTERLACGSLSGRASIFLGGCPGSQRILLDSKQGFDSRMGKLETAEAVTSVSILGMSTVISC